MLCNFQLTFNYIFYISHYIFNSPKGWIIKTLHYSTLLFLANALGQTLITLLSEKGKKNQSEYKFQGCPTSFIVMERLSQ